MRRTLFPLLLAAVLTAAPALAQSDAASDQTTDPREFSEAARKAYAQSLRDARVLVADKKYDEAIALLDKLGTERPREPQARFLKGVALADSGKTDAAIGVFKAVLGDYPELPEPHNNLAVLYAQKGEYGLARDELEAAIAAAPDYVVAYENLGDIYARMAGQSYGRALQLEPANPLLQPKINLLRELPTAGAKAKPAAKK